MTGIGDVTMATAAAALRGLSIRTDVRADNLANVNTPEFRAGTVDFESSLRSALRDGRLESREVGAAISVTHSVPGPHQNLVDVDGPHGKSVLTGTRDGVLRSAMVNAYNFKVEALRTAIGAR